MGQRWAGRCAHSSGPHGLFFGLEKGSLGRLPFPSANQTAARRLERSSLTQCVTGERMGIEEYSESTSASQAGPRICWMFHSPQLSVEGIINQEPV